MLKQAGNPQLEDGHTRIANELLEALIRYPFTGGKLKVVLAVIRLTYGWQAAERPIKQTTLARLTGLDPRYLQRVLTRLRHEGVLFRQRFTHPHRYALNKHYLGWKHAPNLAGKSGQPGLETSAAPGPWARTVKERKKIEKESAIEPAVHNFLERFSQLLHRPLTEEEQALVAHLHALSPEQTEQLLQQVAASCPTQPEGGLNAHGSHHPG